MRPRLAALFFLMIPTIFAALPLAPRPAFGASAAAKGNVTEMSAGAGIVSAVGVAGNVTKISTGGMIAAVGVAGTGSGYLRALVPDAGFYSLPDESALLFYLPETYYVRALREEGAFVCCEYQDTENYYLPLVGYVKKDVLAAADHVPAAPFFKAELTTLRSEPLYADLALASSSLFALAGSRVRYYGSITSPYGELLYFVALGDKCGYVRAAGLSPLAFTPHPDPVPSAPTAGEDDPNDEPSQGDVTVTPSSSSPDGFKIAAIVLLSLVCLCAVVLLFRPTRKKPPDPPRYDESDYDG